MASFYANTATVLVIRHLKLVHLVLVVPQLGQNTRQLALVLRAHLGARNRLVHGRRPTHKHLDVPCLGLRQHRLEQLLGHKALVALPLRRGLVERVKGAEALRVRVFEVLELLLEQDVLLRDVAVDERHLGLVVGVVEDGAADLVHGRDAGAAGDERNVLVLVGRPGVLGQWALEVEALAGHHVVHMRGHGATLIFLDDQVHEAFLAYCHHLLS